MGFGKKYYRDKQREKRETDRKIYTYHGWEKMDGESDRDFRRRFTKRIVIVKGDEKKILDPFGKPIDRSKKRFRL